MNPVSADLEIKNFFEMHQNVKWHFKGNIKKEKHNNRSLIFSTIIYFYIY